MEYVNCFSLCGYETVRTGKIISDFVSSQPCLLFLLPHSMFPMDWKEGLKAPDSPSQGVVWAWPVGSGSTSGPGRPRRSDCVQALLIFGVPYGIRGAVNLKTTLLQGHSMVLSENSFKWFGMFVVNSILYPWFSHSPLEGLLKHSLLVPCLSPQSGWSSRSGAGIYSRKCALRTTVLYPPTFFSMCNLVQHSDARMLSFCRVAPDQSCPMETWSEPNM